MSSKETLLQAAQVVLQEIAQLPYPELKQRAVATRVDAFERGFDQGTLQVEVQYFFDDGRDGPVRAMVSVDDGGSGAFAPPTRDLIAYPDGRVEL